MHGPCILLPICLVIFAKSPHALFLLMCGPQVGRQESVSDGAVAASGAVRGRGRAPPAAPHLQVLLVKKGKERKREGKGTLLNTFSATTVRRKLGCL